ncbi:MAG: hypothetical protein R3F39_03625 [Myxococcota bacterium]
MTTQTFEAGSIREAMFRVLESLGPDAVILGTREVRRAQANAPLRFAVTASKPRTEAATPADVALSVTAVDVEPIEPPPVPPPLPRPSAPARPDAAPPAAPLATQPPPGATAQPTGPPEPQLPAAAFRPAEVPQASSRTPTIPDLPMMRSDESPLASMERRLGAAISDMRDEIARLQRATRRAGPATDDPDPDVRGLVAAGVEPTVAAALVSRARERVAPDRGLAVARQPDLEAEIRALLDPAPALWSRPDRVIAAIVGPTGAGKTRTVAKLAALATFGHNTRVGIITTDTRRIGGLETLEAFCRILGLPLRKARDARGLASAVERYADKDLILVDTPGIGPWDDAELAELDATLSVDGCERHLAIPAVAPAHDVRTVARRFAPRELASILVTKLDEARGPGAALSAAWGGGAHLSHICDGQDVPDACRAVDPIALARDIVARVH